MNSRSGQASTLTKSRVAPSRQKSTFAINPSFTIQGTWPPPVIRNPIVAPINPLEEPNLNPDTPDCSPSANPSQPQQNPTPANPENT